MGIDYSFARIPVADLSYLRQHPIREAIDVVFSRSDMNVRFSPRNDDEVDTAVRHIRMEHDFWLVLRGLLTDLKGAPTQWMQNEHDHPDQIGTIGDVWFGYSLLYFLIPEEVRDVDVWFRQVTDDDLSERFMMEFARYKDMDAEEKESLRVTILACFDDLAQLVRQAAAYNDAFLWYVS